MSYDLSHATTASNSNTSKLYIWSSTSGYFKSWSPLVFTQELSEAKAIHDFVCAISLMETLSYFCCTNLMHLVLASESSWDILAEISKDGGWHIRKDKVSPKVVVSLLLEKMGLDLDCLK